MGLPTTESTETESTETDEVDAALGAMQNAIDNRPAVIGIVLDRSGSMETVREVTISGFNEFKQDQLRQPGTALLSLTMFDTEFEKVHEPTNSSRCYRYPISPGPPIPRQE